MVAIFDTGTERFSNFESPCHPDASFQVSAQSDLLYWRSCDLKNFTMAAWLPSWTSALNNFSNPEFP